MITPGIVMVVVAAVALAITWSANIFEIIVYAAKAFVLYCALQCAVATMVAFGSGPARSRGHGILFAGGVPLSLSVLAFGIPVEGGG